MAWLARMASCGLAALREHLWLLLPGDWRRVPMLQRTVADLLHLAQAAGGQPAAPRSGRDDEMGLQRVC